MSATDTTKATPTFSEIMSDAITNTIIYAIIFGIVLLISSIGDGTSTSRDAPIEMWHIFAASPLIGLWTARWQLPYLTQLQLMHLSFLTGIIAFLLVWHEGYTVGYLTFTAAVILSMKTRNQPKDRD